ncbi:MULTISPECIES: UbiA family prenyltransferase [unclassified Streptomyces]|uniref:UbiA family prenyltransferase n=1 Tax=unclassified Streptomyces TaxID=2593676 RepID=UPI00381BF78A
MSAHADAGPVVPEAAAGPGPLTFLAWANVTIGATAAAMTWITSLALHRPADPLIGLFVFCFIAALHTRDRLQSAGDGTSERSAWMARHARRLTRWAGVCVAVLLALVVARPWCGAALATAGAMSWFYATPLLRWRGRRLAPRQLPGLKLPFVMTVWVVVGVLLPAAQQHRLPDPRTWYLALSVLLIGGVTTLLNDLRDLDADRRDGTRTLPVLLGERRTRLLAYTMAACGVLVGQLVLPVPITLWALYNVTILALYRPRPGVHPRPWADAQGLLFLAVTLLAG